MDVRFGSFASFRTCWRYVRSTPNSRHLWIRSALRIWAISRHDHALRRVIAGRQRGCAPRISWVCNGPSARPDRSSVRMIDQRWLILVVLFVARSSFGYQFQSVASSAALIEAELHIGYAAIGTLIGLYTIPGALLSLPGGVLGARFGDRTVSVTGLVLMIGGGLLMCAGDTVLPLTAGRLISGAGSVLF